MKQDENVVRYGLVIGHTTKEIDPAGWNYPDKMAVNIRYSNTLNYFGFNSAHILSKAFVF